MSEHNREVAGKGSISDPKLPSRGSVLCIFDDADLVNHVEPAIVQAGYIILRARHGMHGYWMAITGNPDVIVTDIAEPARESDYLMECLSRNTKTTEIPLIALVDAKRQQVAAASCLRHATMCVRKDIELSDLLKHIASFTETSGQRRIRCDEPRARNVDAFFSQLGHQRSRPPRVVAKMLKSQQRQDK